MGPPPHGRRKIVDSHCRPLDAEALMSRWSPAAAALYIGLQGHLGPFAERMSQSSRIADWEQFEVASGQSDKASSQCRAIRAFRFNIWGLYHGATELRYAAPSPIWGSDFWSAWQSPWEVDLGSAPAWPRSTLRAISRISAVLGRLSRARAPPEKGPRPVPQHGWRGQAPGTTAPLPSPWPIQNTFFNTFFWTT